MGKHRVLRTMLCRARPQVEWLEDRRVLSTLRPAPVMLIASSYTAEPTALVEESRTEEPARTPNSTETTSAKDFEPARTSETAPRSTEQLDPAPSSPPPSSSPTFMIQPIAVDSFEAEPSAETPREDDSGGVRPEETEPAPTTTFSAAGPISTKTTTADPAEPGVREPQPRQPDAKPAPSSDAIDVVGPVKTVDRADVDDPANVAQPVNEAQPRPAAPALNAAPADGHDGQGAINESPSVSVDPGESGSPAPAQAVSTESRDQGVLAGEAAPSEISAELAALAESAPALDAAPLAAALGAFLDGLEDFGRQLAQAPREMGLPFWIVAAALATGACEVGRRQLRRGAALSPSARDSDPLEWTLGLPEA